MDAEEWDCEDEGSDEMDYASMLMEEAEVAAGEAKIAAISQEMVLVLKDIHRQILANTAILDAMWDIPVCKTSFERLDGMVDRIAQIEEGYTT